MRLHLTGLLLFSVFLTTVNGFPLPFSRSLSLNDKGNDVVILQSLLLRYHVFVHPGDPHPFNVTGVYGKKTDNVASEFMWRFGCGSAGSFGSACQELLLSSFLDDKYHDPYPCYIPQGFKYKLYIPVHADRSIETEAQFYGLPGGKCSKGASQFGGCCGELLKTFRTHTRGQNADVQLNCLTANGATPTGLMAVDWNGPEPDPKSFGPYPVNRNIWAFNDFPTDYPPCYSNRTGSSGPCAFPPNTNALVVTNDLQNLVRGKDHPIRWGILVHTGEWEGWKPPMEMPNSHGCVHSWPEGIRYIAQLAENYLGVNIRTPNPGGQWPYPFQAQGVLSIEQVDDV